MEITKINNYQQCVTRINELKKLKSKFIQDAYTEVALEEWLKETISQKNEINDSDVTSVFSMIGAMIAKAAHNHLDTLIISTSEGDTFAANTNILKKYIDNSLFDIIYDGSEADEMLGEYPILKNRSFPYIYPLLNDYEYGTSEVEVITRYTEDAYCVFNKLYNVIEKNEEEVKSFLNRVGEYLQRD